jgi:hypothetical protein
MWHSFKIVCFGTVQVGLKDEASRVDIVELNHPHRWRTCSIARSNRHGGWHQLTCVSSLPEPVSELSMGIRVQVGLVQRPIKFIVGLLSLQNRHGHSRFEVWASAQLDATGSVFLGFVAV